MAKRRGDGEGSIYQTKDGRWRAEVSLGWLDGKKRRKILYGRTRAEVSEQLKRTLRDQQLGINVAPAKQTVGAYLASWLENTAKPKNRPSTVQSYSWIIREHLTPGLGKVSLDKLTPQRVQEFLAERHQGGLSAATVKHIRATLRTALSQAQRWGLVHQNVAKLVTVPSAVRYNPTVLTPAQAKALLTFANVERLGPFLALALTTGLRRGELLGLRWSDVDFETGELRVRQSLARIKGEGLQPVETKSARSRRTVSLPQPALEALLSQRDTQTRERAWAGSRWQESGFVFRTTIGTPLIPEQANEALRRVLAAAGLPHMRMHDLRHSTATLLLSQGVHPKLVQELLGHSTFQLTMDTYSHVIPALRNEVASKMNEVFAPTPTNSPTKAQRVLLQ